MKFEILRFGMVATALAMAGCATQEAGVQGPAGKNVYDVKYAPLPGNYATMIKDAPEEWNFNFRQYGARRVAAGEGRVRL